MSVDPLLTPDCPTNRLLRTIVLDATCLLPADPGRSRAEYLTAHIPVARPYQIDAVAYPSADHRIWCRTR